MFTVAVFSVGRGEEGRAQKPPSSRMLKPHGGKVLDRGGTRGWVAAGRRVDSTLPDRNNNSKRYNYYFCVLVFHISSEGIITFV